MYPGAYPMQAPTNQKALWAMILGIPSVICCGIFTGIPALILGIIARREVQESGGTQKGEGMALAGIILGVISIAFSIIFTIFYIGVLATGVRHGFYRTY